MNAPICLIRLERNCNKYWNDYNMIIITYKGQGNAFSDILLTNKNNALMQSTAEYCKVLQGIAKYCKKSKYSIHLTWQLQIFSLRVYKSR